MKQYEKKYMSMLTKKKELEIELEKARIELDELEGQIPWRELVRDAGEKWSTS